MAFIAGAGLSMAGSIYQDIFRNPLASPDLIGVTSGAGAGAAFAIVCFGQNAGAAVGSAFAGGLIAVEGRRWLWQECQRQKAVSDFCAGRNCNTGPG